MKRLLVAILAPVLVAQTPVIVTQGGNQATVSAGGAVKVDGSAVTQPISAVSLPLPSTAATSTKQSDGTQKTQIVDGAGNVIGATTNALDINIKSGNPTTITATQATGTNLHTVVDSGAVTATLNAETTKVIGTVNVSSGQTIGIAAGSAVIGALTANQSVNVAQINGVTTTMGNGVSGTGVQRVTIASDSTGQVALAAGSAIVGKVGIDQTTPGTTNLVALTAETTKVIGTARMQGNVGGVMDAANNASAPANVLVSGFEAATQGTTQPSAATAGNVRRAVISQDGALYVRQGGPVNFTCSADNIAASLTQLTGCGGAGASLKYYITDIIAQSTTTTAGQFLLRTGTGTNCGTGTASIFPSSATVVRLAAPANTAPPLSVNFTTPLQTAANVQICVLGVATNTVTIQVSGYSAP